MRIRFVALVSIAVGCGGGEPPAQSPSASPASPPPSAASAAPASVASSAAPVASAAPPAPPKPKPRFAGAAFPPADFAAPHERSAEQGDGKWVPLGSEERGERIATEPPLMYRSTVHPHEVSKWKKLTLVAIDLRRVDVHYQPGSADVKQEQLADGSVPGLVRERHVDDLLVVFNGGFKPRHGGWGMYVADTELVPPKPEGCTVALHRDGRVRVLPWPRTSGEVEGLRAYRQTPPCLLIDGELEERLQHHNERAWGGRNPKRKTRRRSAIGVDASGRVLIYGMGEEVGPRMLAMGMKAAGAVEAAQLDINWSWTRFLVMGRTSPDDTLSVTSTLIPKMVHTRTGYVERKVARDFFYVVSR